MKKKSAAPTVTEIAFILDRSGSMQPVTEAAIAGFNQFLRDQQVSESEGEGISRLTLVQFDDQYEVPVDNLPVSEVVSLDTSTYVPRGSTALLDAVGTTIETFKKRIKALPEDQRPGQVVFAIFTDGWENSSVRYTWIDIAKMIKKRREKDGWEFLFLAANQDAIATASQMNINAHHAATSDHSGRGMRSSSRAFSRKIRAMKQANMDIYANEAPPRDLDASMADLLKEEEERDEE